MSIAFWCVLFAGVMPVLTVALAKAGAKGFDNANPRESLENAGGVTKRLDSAHRNHFEAFPLFAVAVIVATLMHGDRARVDALAIAFIGLRLLYTVMYATNRSSLRTLVWFLGYVCVIAIFLQANVAAS